MIPHSAKDQADWRVGRTGLWLGAAAVLCWSFGSALVYMGAREAGTWPFVFATTITGGGLQLLFRYTMQREIKTALMLPWRLWLGPVLCFVIYGLVWPCALAGSTTEQVPGVNLINYLWPVLTVLLSVWCVPGIYLTRSVVLSVALAIGGLLCANGRSLHDLFTRGSDPSIVSSSRLPYVLAAIAAMSWAIYSALLARWRPWARHYVTSPVGFLLVACVAGTVLLARRRSPGPLRFGAWLAILAYGVGPLAAGYLLWDLALARARVQSLSVLAAATPVLSTLVLSCYLRSAPGVSVVLAALLIGAGVILSVAEPGRFLKATPAAVPADNGTQAPTPRGSPGKAPGIF